MTWASHCCRLRDGFGQEGERGMAGIQAKDCRCLSLQDKVSKLCLIAKAGKSVESKYKSPCETVGKRLPPVYAQ